MKVVNQSSVGHKSTCKICTRRAFLFNITVVLNIFQLDKYFVMGPDFKQNWIVKKRYSKIPK